MFKQRNNGSRKSFSAPKIVSQKLSPPPPSPPWYPPILGLYLPKPPRMVLARDGQATSACCVSMYQDMCQGSHPAVAPSH